MDTLMKASNIESMALYDLADALQMRLLLADGKVTGNLNRNVNFGGLKVLVPLKVVSSVQVGSTTIVILRSLGNLALLMARDTNGLLVIILDLAKISGKLEDCLDNVGYDDLDGVTAMLATGIVRKMGFKFRGVDSGRWSEF